jgi:hypothetical protein
MKLRTLAVAILAATIAVPALAQEDVGALTWVAYSRAKPGKTQDWMKMAMQNDKPVFDKLMTEGTIRSWGIATPINHRPGFEWNLLIWVTVDDWAGVEKWAGASMQAMMARSPEEQKELMEAGEKVEEQGSHFDEVVRQAHASMPATPQKFGYFYVGHFRANPGQFDAATQLYKDVVAPVAEKLKSEGVVVSYGLHVQELHGQMQPGEKPWTHRIWYALPNLAANDKRQAALAAAMTPEQQKRRAEVFDPRGHKDDVLMVLHLGGAPAE